MLCFGYVSQIVFGALENVPSCIIFMNDLVINKISNTTMTILSRGLSRTKSLN